MLRKEFDTPKKNRFFDAFDTREKGVSLTKICQREDINVSESTGSRWLVERQQLGEQALRRTRKLSHRLGQPRKVTEKAVQRCLDQNDPVHHLRYPSQVVALDLNCHPRSLQRRITKDTGAKRFKRPRTSYIRAINKQSRIQYGYTHQKRTVRGFWRFILFTDEVHMNTKDLATQQE